MSERLGKIHFFLSFLFFNGTFFPMHIIGMHGHMRRIADPYLYKFLDNPSTHFMNEFMTVSALLLGATQLIIVWNFFVSLVLGKKASDNPWHANSLEWATTSPPPHYNFMELPTVYHPAYEYSIPGMVEDYLPQTRPRPTEAGPLDPVMA